MMNGGMPASGANMGQMGGQMGMNPMVMGRMPMGPDQVGADVAMSERRQESAGQTVSSFSRIQSRKKYTRRSDNHPCFYFEHV